MKQTERFAPHIFLHGGDYNPDQWLDRPEILEEDIRLIREMGADAIRTAHYPQSRHVYDLCDRAGLICWVEFPNVNRVTFSDEFERNVSWVKTDKTGAVIDEGEDATETNEEAAQGDNTQGGGSGDNTQGGGEMEP